jgi:Uma2 family endonuclease
MPATGLAHSDHVFRLTAELRRRGLRAVHGLTTYLPPAGPGRGRRTEVRPDVVVVSRGNPDQGGDGPYAGVPDLVVEVLDADEPNDPLKASAYAAAGVHHYWLVRLKWGTLEAAELGAGGEYRQTSAGALVPFELLPVPPDLR